MKPETRYARTADDVHIAYQIAGDGPIDLVFVPGFVCNVELLWDLWPAATRFVERLATFSRLIVFDRRGTGLSDRILPRPEQLTLEGRMDDIRAVMDAAGSDRAAILSFEEGGFQVGAVFAATYPDRVAAFISLSGGAGPWAPDYPVGWRAESWQEYLAHVDRAWGTQAFAEEEGAWIWPEIKDDPRWFADYATFLRRSVSPGDAIVLLGIDSQTDVRDVLPSIRVPTLVINRVDDEATTIEEARYIADRIPGARLVAMPGGSHGWMAPDQDAILDYVEAFLGHLRAEEAELDRVLATILVTDIVGSTGLASRLGDRAWAETLDRHRVTVRGLLARYRGVEVDTAGDGFLARFEGPARAVRCAESVVAAAGLDAVELRVGVHTGEIEMHGEEIRGIAVHIAARVAALAGPGEVLLSSTVRDLTAGSGLAFEDAGEHELKGVPDRWRLYRVVSGG
jgi:class 3 adenylate cyclase